MKRLLTIQDISCFGKCSLTVALPIISALGIETVALPTALLSTHTGEFKDYTFLSLTEEMEKIIKHWKKENITFDAIYVGYIGSLHQVDVICNIIDIFKNDNTIVYVDPAMADNARLYSGLSEEYVSATRKLCKKADIISPNIYEAMLLANSGLDDKYSFDDANKILNEISNFCQKSIITGVHSGNDIYSLGFDASNNTYSTKKNKKIDGMFYGTGDVFASTFIGLYLNGFSFEKAISYADDFVQECIIATLDEKEKYWYGINFEKRLKKLCSLLESEKE